jgi:hypothetical protein
VDIAIPPFDFSTDPTDAPTPAASYMFPPFRAAARRAFHLLRFLKDCPHERVFLVTLDRKGALKGVSCIAEGGITRAHIRLPDLLLQARSLSAVGILLVQNRPGVLHQGFPIDAHITLKTALVCDLLGLPLIEHIYIDPVGTPTFMRERGALQGVAPLFHAIEDRLTDLAVQAWQQGLCDPEQYGHSNVRAAEETPRFPTPSDSAPSPSPKPTPEVLVTRRPTKAVKKSHPLTV